MDNTLSNMLSSTLEDPMVIEILSRLPTKSLYRFQCVSKTWKKLIPGVISQRDILLPLCGLFFNRKFFPIDAPHNKEICRKFASRLGTLPSHNTLVTLDICNGLFLFREGPRGPYIVWNPATMENVTLPELSSRFLGGYWFLAYNPCVSPHYKVIRFTYACVNARQYVVIYSSTTGRWTESSDPSELVIPMDSAPVFHKDTLYLLAHLPADRISCFDVNKGIFHFINLPHKKKKAKTACIGVSRGHLFYAVYLKKQTELKIYMLDEQDSNKWVLEHKKNNTFGCHGKVLCQPIAFNPESEVIYLDIRINKSNMIVFYDHGNGKLEVHEAAHFVHPKYVFPIFPVIPSLQSINPPGENLLAHFL